MLLQKFAVLSGKRIPLNTNNPLRRATANSAGDFHGRVFAFSTEARRVGTHSGSFHCDDALACFMIRLTDKFSNAEIVRTRDPQVHLILELSLHFFWFPRKLSIGRSNVSFYSFSSKTNDITSFFPVFSPLLLLLLIRCWTRSMRCSMLVACVILTEIVTTITRKDFRKCLVMDLILNSAVLALSTRSEASKYQLIYFIILL